MARFEGYEVVEELGRGGQATVYEVRETATGARRALKVLSGALEPESVERFRREAIALDRLGGEGVVPIRRTGFEGGRLFLVMDVMPGGSLGERLRARHRLEWREAVALGVELARTLERAAAAGLVHRDLKPSNVLFDDADRPRIADFGLVRDLRGASLTETGTVLGTPGYMAPEQLDGRKVDARADVFALGALLHEALTGERAFPGATPAQVGVAIKARRRARARVASSCPERLDALLDRMLALDAGERPSAAAVVKELHAILAAKPAGPWPLTLALLGSATAAAVGVSLALAFRSAPPPPEPAPRPAPPTPRPPAPPPRPLVDPEQRAKAIALAKRSLQLSHAQQDDAGLKAAEEALEIDPGCTLAWVARAFARRHKDKADPDGSAFSDVSRALEIDPYFGPALQERSKHHYNRRDWQGVIRDVEALFRFSPETANAADVTRRAEALYALGSYDAAIADATDALGREPGNRGAHKIRGLAYAARAFARAESEPLEADKDREAAKDDLKVCLEPSTNEWPDGAEIRAMQGRLAELKKRLTSKLGEER